LGAGEEDVQRKIAFISGDRIFWGAEAIIELCRWFDWPYPLARFGYLVPKPLRDVLYQIVADNRYRWCAAGPYRHRSCPAHRAVGCRRFGTQALDKNFARQLCPYYYFKKKDGDKKGGEGAAKEGAGEAAAGTPAGDAREEDEVRVQAAALLAVADARAHAGLRSSGRRWRRRRPTSR